MAEDRDKGYRLLFSHPWMVENLLRLFVGGEWLTKLDFATLEKVSERDLSVELFRREKDLLWRLRFGDPSTGETGWFYVYLHFEFQTEPEPFMALRTSSYKLLLLEDLIRQGALTASGRLPPVFTVVVYTGKTRWKAARSLTELIEPLPGLEGAELPSGFSLLGYHLVEEHGLAPDELEPLAGPVARLFELDQSHGLEEVEQVVGRLVQELAGPDHQGLRQAFKSWLAAVVLPTVAPEVKVSEISDLMEVRSMLQQNVIEWREGWIEQGRRKGRQEGRQQGRQEGEAAVLLRQLDKRFGHLSPAVRKRVEAAKADQLLLWADRILTAANLDDVFAP